jgi:hypothetical protein
MSTSQDDKSKPTGFAGLDSLVSNVERDLTAPPSAQSTKAIANPDATSRCENEEIDRPPVVPPTAAHESPKSHESPSSGSGARWAVGLAIGIGVLSLLANIDRKSSTPSFSPPPAPVASVPSQDVSPTSGIDLPGEEMPPLERTSF